MGVLKKEKTKSKTKSVAAEIAYIMQMTARLEHKKRVGSTTLANNIVIDDL